ncbi:hypothetical protein LTR05_004153 [Lithohypha guttulata]|uniref:Uncharacterized protein n=1 Tax=Lithohypha guttulata TaxID=1690604 RepID=A0AAN7T304_9EURO|nr:hypothetical protein LTR05_004153 [Lithohypha guttulata]
MTATTNFVMEEALAYAQPLQVDLVIERAMGEWSLAKILKARTINRTSTAQLYDHQQVGDKKTSMSLRNLFSSSSSSQPKPTPFLTFIGPSPQSSSLSSLFSSADVASTISIYNVNTNTTMPIFSVHTSKHSKPNLVINRILPNNAEAPFATATLSSMSGNIAISLYSRTGQEIPITMESDWASASSRTFQSSMGNFRWKHQDSELGYKMVTDDQERRKLATWQEMSGSGSTTGYPRLEFYVQPASDEFVEMVLATGLAAMKADEKEAKQVGKIFEALAGA